MFSCNACRREGQGKLLVDAVTLETLKVPDRDAERELVDAVNDATPELLRDVVRCFRTKLDHPAAHVQLLALQSLDACFRGCGSAFHEMMAAKDLLDSVVRLVLSETLQVEDEVRDKARRLIQSWARSTRLVPFQEALAELAAEGCDGADVAEPTAKDVRVFGLASGTRGAGAAAAGRAGLLGRGPAAGGGRGAADVAAAEREGLLSDAEEVEGLLRPRGRAERAQRGAAKPQPPPARGAANGSAPQSPQQSPQARQGGREAGGAAARRDGSDHEAGPSRARAPAGAPSPQQQLPQAPPPQARSSGGAAAAPPPPRAPPPAAAPPPVQPQRPPLPFESADPEEAALLQEMLASNLKEEAEALYNGGHYEAAEKVFTQALLYAPTDRALFCGRSQCLAAQGRLEEALTDARSVVDAAPEWHVGHGLEAGVLAELGAAEDALDAFEVAARFAEADGDAPEELEEYQSAAAALTEQLRSQRRR